MGIAFTVTPLGPTGLPNNYTRMQDAVDAMLADNGSGLYSFTLSGGDAGAFSINWDSWTGASQIALTIQADSTAWIRPWVQNDSTVACISGSSNLASGSATSPIGSLTLQGFQLGVAATRGIFTQTQAIDCSHIVVDSLKLAVPNYLGTGGAKIIVNLNIANANFNGTISNCIGFSTATQSAVINFVKVASTNRNSTMSIYSNTCDLTNATVSNTSFATFGIGVSGHMTLDIRNNLVVSDFGTASLASLVFMASLTGVTIAGTSAGNTTTATDSTFLGSNSSTGVLASPILVERSNVNYTVDTIHGTWGATTATSPLAVDALGQSRAGATVYGGAFNATVGTPNLVTYNVTPNGATGGNYLTLQRVFTNMEAHTDDADYTIKLYGGNAGAATFNTDNFSGNIRTFALIADASARATAFPQNDTTVAHIAGGTLSYNGGVGVLYVQNFSLSGFQFGNSTTAGFMTSLSDISATGSMTADGVKVVLPVELGGAATVEKHIVKFNILRNCTVYIENCLAYASAAQTARVHWFSTVNSTYDTRHHLFSNSFDLTNLNNASASALYCSNAAATEEFDSRNNLILSLGATQGVDVFIATGTGSGQSSSIANTITGTGSAYTLNASTGVTADQIWLQRTAGIYTITATAATLGATSTSSPLSTDMVGNPRRQAINGLPVVFGGAVAAIGAGVYNPVTLDVGEMICLALL